MTDRDAMRPHRRPRPLLLPLLAAALTLLSPLPLHADVNVEHTFQVSQEYDDNVRREEKGETHDLLLRFLYRMEGVFHFERQRLSLRLQVGGKKYLSLLDVEGLQGDALLTRIEGNWQRLLTERFGLKIEESAQGRLIRDFEERSIDNNGNLGAFLLLPWDLDLLVTAGYVFFDYNDTTVEPFRFLGDRYLLTMSRPFGPALSCGVAYAFQRRYFSFDAVTLRAPEEEGSFAEIVFDDLGVPRRDLIHEMTAYLQYARRFVFRLSYTFQRDFSNSYRGDFVNHRVQVNFSRRLLSSLTFLLLGKFQFKVYDDPAIVTRTIVIDENTEEPTEVLQRFENQNENLSSLEVKLVHPIGSGLSIDLKYGFFFLFQPGEKTYLRNIVGIGLRKRF